MTVGTRRLVLIVGMHRSGSSLLADAVRRTGVPMGARFLQATDANPAGYFEHVDVVAAHDRLLRALERAWASPGALLDMPAGWLDSAAAATARAELGALLAGELDAHEGLFAVKDPRICRLLPLWQRVAADVGVRVSYVMALRGPAAVAASLTRRDGLGRDHGELLWLRHHLEAARAIGAAPCPRVAYTAWFDAPEATARALRDQLAAQLDPPAALAVPDAAAFVTPAYRHVTTEGRATNPLADHVHRTLAQASTGLPTVALGRADRAVAAAERRLAGWGEEIARKETRFAVHLHELNERDTAIADLDSQVRYRDQLVSELRGEHDRLDGEIRYRDQLVSELRGEHDRLDGEIRYRDQLVSELRGEQARLDGEIRYRDALIAEHTTTIAAARERVLARYNAQMSSRAFRLLARLRPAGVPSPDAVAARDLNGMLQAKEKLDKSLAWRLSSVFKSLRVNSRRVTGRGGTKD